MDSKDQHQSQSSSVKVALVASWFKPLCEKCDELEVTILSHGIGAVCPLIEAEKPCKYEGEKNSTT